MFERPSHGGRAVLVHVEINQLGDDEASDLDEFRELASSTGCEQLALISVMLKRPNPRYFLGKGKAQEVADTVRESAADLVIINHSLSPGQERNLESLFRCRVLDRTGMILDIFAQRARSFEGKLQVELAQLRYLSTRLVRGWSHLERQKGGIGLRGPGEKQLETDRRLLGQRITSIRKRLERVARQREQGRQARKRADVPTVSLVGYTNAGKSTLFNTLCDESVYAADQLFATLDPTLRRLSLESGSVVLADTVGFVRHLPHDLIAAFRATLTETREADLLLHVVDASDERRADFEQQVNQVLEEVGAGEVPQLMVYNKIDLSGDPALSIQDPHTEQVSAWVSALRGEGVDELKSMIARVLAVDVVQGEVELEPAAGELRAWLYREASVLDEQVTDRGHWRIRVRLPKRDYHRMLKKFPQAEIVAAS